MSSPQALTTIEPSAYDAIEAAMTESSRGRWFLAEYARRNRTADTEMLLGAIGRIENAVSGERGLEGVGRLRGDLMEMASAIARTKAEIAAISAPDQDQTRLSVASEALDAIVRATERATSDILGAAEEVQEAAWTLREGGAEPAICDELDRRATQIYTACSFQDLTAQRTGRIVHTLRYLEDRLLAMIAIWGDADDVPLAPDAMAGRPQAEARAVDLDQCDVDRYIDMDGTPEAAPFRGPLTGAVPLCEDIVFVHADATEAELPAADAAQEPEAASFDVDPMADLMADPAAMPDADEKSALEAEPELDFAAPAPEAAVPADEPAETAIEEQDEPATVLEVSPADILPSKPPPLADALSIADIDALSIEEKIALFS
ncbi:hypothetical protein [Methylobacterium sp. A54F]